MFIFNWTFCGFSRCQKITWEMTHREIATEKLPNSTAKKMDTSHMPPKFLRAKGSALPPASTWAIVWNFKQGPSLRSALNQLFRVMKNLAFPLSTPQLSEWVYHVINLHHVTMMRTRNGQLPRYLGPAVWWSPGGAN